MGMDSVELVLAWEDSFGIELFHGTATRFLDSIRVQGPLAGERQHVHLSADYPSAMKVGQRHGKPVALRVQAAEMVAVGHEFYLSENGVWLTDHVPPEFVAGI